jgi:parallel beta-helix repeat protein
MMTADFFVSPQGNDAWSGSLAEQNRAGTDGPFRTVARAQQAVRKLKTKDALTQPVRVALRGGTYFLDGPLTFTSEDSGVPEEGRGGQTEAPERPVIYAAYGGERPVLSGGCRITGWREEQVNGRKAWAASIPEVQRGEWYFRQLFVNGSRRMRPRLPKHGLFRIEEAVGARFGDDWNETIQRGSDRFIYAKGDLRPWHNLQDVEITVLARWESVTVKIKELEESKRLVIFDRNSERRMTDDFKDVGAPYYVENVFEALKEPGQWYLDRPAGRLYYLPLPGERMETADVIAPYLVDLVRIEGGAEPVQCMQFEGIAFAHTEWPVPPDVAAVYQSATKVPAAVTLRGAEKVRFEGCTFEQLGTHGLGLIDGCRDVEIAGCDLHDLGAGGIMIRDNCRRNTVRDCEISYTGVLFHGSAGIMIGKSSGNKVVHNHIHDLTWMGVSVGWTWGYGESDGYGNIIEYNHIHDLGKGELLSDIGGIYTLGVSPGTRIRYNLIHDIRKRGYGGWGIYLDEGSTDILVENNLVYRAQSAGFHQHYGRDNLLRNNIFALNTEQQIQRTRAEDHRSFIFEQNIVYADASPMVTDQEWTPEGADFERNLYFDASGTPDFAGKTFEEWQAMGMDAGSVVADPLFVDPGSGDFRLRPDSPAFALGFKEFDLSTVGVRSGNSILAP